MRELFRAQLDTGIPCTGDYLNGQEKSVVIDTLIKSSINTTTGVPALTEESATEFIDNKIADYQAHKDERLCHYMLEGTVVNGNMNIKIHRVWENDIDALSDQFAISRVILTVKFRDLDRNKSILNATKRMYTIAVLSMLDKYCKRNVVCGYRPIFI